MKRLKKAYIEAETVTEYWLKHYVVNALCSLCGNTGIIDTRGVRTPAGIEAGRLNWCICPNGQAHRSHAGGALPEHRPWSHGTKQLPCGCIVDESITRVSLKICDRHNGQ
jgi:hypothetical protein